MWGKVTHVFSFIGWNGSRIQVPSTQIQQLEVKISAVCHPSSVALYNTSIYIFQIDLIILHGEKSCHMVNFEFTGWV